MQDSDERTRLLDELARVQIDAGALAFEQDDPTGTRVAARALAHMRSSAPQASPSPLPLPPGGPVTKKPDKPPDGPPGRLPRCPPSVGSGPVGAGDFAPAPGQATPRPPTTDFTTAARTPNTNTGLRAGALSCDCPQPPAEAFVRVRPATLPGPPTGPEFPVGVPTPDPDEPKCLRAGELGLEPPRRPTTTSLMNGQIYDVRVASPVVWDSQEWVIPRVRAPSQGWHAPFVASHAVFFSGLTRLWAIEVLDDDGNYNSRVTENLTVEQLIALRLRYREGAVDTVPKDAWRPRSITACVVSEKIFGEGDDAEYSFSTRFAVSWIGDNWGADQSQNDVENWDLHVDLELQALNALIAAKPRIRRGGRYRCAATHTRMMRSFRAVSPACHSTRLCAMPPCL